MQRRNRIALLTSLSLFAAGSLLACDEKTPKATDEKEQAARDQEARTAEKPERATANEQGKQAKAEGKEKDAGPPQSLDDFEGEIALELDPGDDSKAHLVELKIKGGQMRIDLPTETGGRASGYQVVNLRDAKMTTVVRGQKIAVELEFDDMKEQFSALVPPSDSAKESAKTQLKKTEKKDEVAGYSCREWELQAPGEGMHRMCVADLGANWFQFPEGKRPTDDPWAKELFDGKHFPLRLIQVDADGKQVARMEVKEIVSKKLEDQLFSAPSDYRKIAVADMMQGMGLAELGQGKQAPAPADIPPEVRELVRGAEPAPDAAKASDESKAK